MPSFNLDRTNQGNTGKSFEHELELVFRTFEARKIARIRKVDPPVRIVGGGFAKKTIMLPNPFLDYAGAFYKDGQAIFLEAKSTQTHRLPLMSSGGLTETQVAALRGWNAAGAWVGVVWRHDFKTVFLTFDTIRLSLDMKEKSLRFEDYSPLKTFEEIVIPDCLKPLDNRR